MHLKDNSMAVQITVSIIIVNWNTRDILKGCLASIRQETRTTYEVIVVDNDSSDGSAEMIKKEFPETILVENNRNRGFAAANNQGLEVARGQRLLLLNPDTIILENAVDVMLFWLDEHPDVGCVGCQVWEDERTIQKTCFAEPGLWHVFLIEFGLQKMFPMNSILGRPEYGDWDRRTEQDVDVVSGMFMLVPRDVVDKIGLLDEAFFIYSEEADWCRRIRNANYRCVFSPLARILHLDGGSKSTEQIRSRMYVQLQKSKVIYLGKHYGWFGSLLGRAIFLTSAFLRLVLSMLRRDAEGAARRRLAKASLIFQLTGKEPTV